MFRCRQCGAFNRVGAGQSGVPTCGRCKADLDVSGAPQEVDEATFDRVVAGAPVPVLVDFWAPWCGPCRMAAPMLDALGRREAGRVLVFKVNTDEHPGPSQRLGVRGIPTFMLFRDGRERARQAGVLPADALARWLGQHLSAV